MFMHNQHYLAANSLNKKPSVLSVECASEN